MLSFCTNLLHKVQNNSNFMHYWLSWILLVLIEDFWLHKHPRSYSRRVSSSWVWESRVFESKRCQVSLSLIMNRKRWKNPLGIIEVTELFSISPIMPQRSADFFSAESIDQRHERSETFFFSLPISSLLNFPRLLWMGRLRLSSLG